MKEKEWKSISGWSNYRVSADGKILSFGVSKSGKLLSISKDGYVTLVDKERAATISVGRLVLLAFEGPPPSKEANLARHLDDNRLNNNLWNLAWGTYKQNSEDSIRNGGRDFAHKTPFREKCRIRMIGSKQSEATKAKRKASLLAFHARKRYLSDMEMQP
jgi:hypothetical protein